VPTRGSRSVCVRTNRAVDAEPLYGLSIVRPGTERSSLPSAGRLQRLSSRDGRYTPRARSLPGGQDWSRDWDSGRRQAAVDRAQRNGDVLEAGCGSSSPQGAISRLRASSITPYTAAAAHTHGAACSTGRASTARDVVSDEALVARGLWVGVAEGGADECDGAESRAHTDGGGPAAHRGVAADYHTGRCY